MVIGERDKNSKSNSPFFGPNRRITCSWVKSVNKVFVCRLGELCWVTVGQLICQPRLEASFPPDCWLRWQRHTHTNTLSLSCALASTHTHHLTRLAEPRGALNSERAANMRRDTCRWITFPEHMHAAPELLRPPVTEQRLTASDRSAARMASLTRNTQTPHTLHTPGFSKGELCQCCQIGFWSLIESRNAWILLKISKYNLRLTAPINW